MLICIVTVLLEKPPVTLLLFFDPSCLQLCDQRVLGYGHHCVSTEGACRALLTAAVPLWVQDSHRARLQHSMNEGNM
jgi:hypothetical protein